MNNIICLRLGCDYETIAYVTHRNREFVAVALPTNSATPFVSYELNGPATLDGHLRVCVQGDYCRTRPEAIASMLRRAGLTLAVSE